MIGELFFGAALALGQAPAAPAVAPRAMPMPILQTLPNVKPMPPMTSSPAAMPAAPSSNGTAATPLTLKEGEQLVPNGDGTYRIENGSAGTAPASEEKKPDEPKPPEKYAFMSIIEDTWLGKRMDKSGISIYGWTETSFTASTARHTNLPITTNDFANDFQLNQNYMVISKAVDASKKEFQLGFRADLILPGSDARFTITRGLLDRQLTSGPTAVRVATRSTCTRAMRRSSRQTSARKAPRSASVNLQRTANMKSFRPLIRPSCPARTPSSTTRSRTPGSGRLRR